MKAMGLTGQILMGQAVMVKSSEVSLLYLLACPFPRLTKSQKNQFPNITVSSPKSLKVKIGCPVTRNCYILPLATARQKLGVFCRQRRIWLGKQHKLKRLP